ncbi:MAG: hypothetical protein WCX88_02800, partial [Patescibacteria group bacterium]
MSMFDVWNIGSVHFCSNNWYVNYDFARKEKTSFGWLLIKKVPVSKSTSKNWSFQEDLLSKLERVPSAAEISWFITTYFDVRGVRLFKRACVRTSSRDSKDCHVIIGEFKSDGLCVYSYEDWDESNDLGLSATRKRLIKRLIP